MGRMGRSESPEEIADVDAHDSEFCPRSCLGCRYRCRGIENENDDAETIYIQMLLCGPTLIIIRIL